VASGLFLLWHEARRAASPPDAAANQPPLPAVATVAPRR
jgi:hypothetical protein